MGNEDRCRKARNLYREEHGWIQERKRNEPMDTPHTETETAVRRNGEVCIQGESKGQAR